MTNGDRIRAMTDEELVRNRAKINSDYCKAVSPKKCPKKEWQNNLSPCDVCFSAWLRQPYDGGEDDG